MPIDYSKYPANWLTEIRPRILERAGHRCEACRAENYKPHPVTGSKVVLTIAHVDHDLNHNDDDNLRAWCQRCHNRHDAPMRAEHRRQTRAKKCSQFQTALVVMPSRSIRPYRGRWWKGGPGSLLVRLATELPAIDDGMLWRLPLYVTGCKSLGQLDAEGWDYQIVKDRVVAILMYAKAAQARSRNHVEHRTCWGTLYLLPANVS